jgi:hypothetical protein
MKSLSLALILSIGTGYASAQGTIVFDNRVTGIIVTHVYAPLPSNPFFHQTGNGSADTPIGTQDWTGFNPIGANGTGGQYGAGTVFAQLLGVGGSGQPESSLQPAIPVVSFRTGSAAGSVTPTIATFNNIPVNSVQETIEMVAWDNSSGLYPTWAQAFTAWQTGLIAAGESGRWNQDSLGPQPAPNMINGQDPSQHVASFNLYFIPEPSAFVLGSLGAVALILRRQKRNR